MTKEFIALLEGREMGRVKPNGAAMPCPKFRFLSALIGITSDRDR
jgi:hypothetical protein